MASRPATNTTTNTSYVADATIDGSVYVIAGNRLNPGIYAARWNGKTLELLGRGKNGKLQTYKMQLITKAK